MNAVVERLNAKLHHLRALVTTFCTDEEVLSLFDEPEEMIAVLVVSKDAVLHGMCRLNGKLSMMHVSDSTAVPVRHEWMEGTFLEHTFLTAVDADAEESLGGEPGDAMASVACAGIAIHEDSSVVKDWLIITDSDSPEILEYTDSLGDREEYLQTEKGQFCEVRRMKRGNAVIVGLVGEASLRSTGQQIAFVPDQEICAHMLRAWETDTIVHLPSASEARFDA